jgi:dipeptidase
MCTTMIITKGATIDGSMIVAHSDDNELADQRIIYVPAQEHKMGAIRKVFAEAYYYPRLVTDDRGDGYDTHGPKIKETEPIGGIPQVDYTFAYFDGAYGIMNEHNLMIGECTCGVKYQPSFVTAEQARKEEKHVRLFYSQELSHIALERCKKARDAVSLMGDIIDEYGLYSSGETLLIADENEAWVFEMCALPDEVYHSAWVARRVPDGYVFVAANEFRIREIDTKNKDDFMFSSLLYPGAKKLGWWDGESPMDWLRTVSDGEYNHPYYSLRRVWRVFDRVNPDLCLSPWVEDGFTTDYPFAIRGNRKLSISDVFSLYRDHYEGTQFDLTKGVAAGPYGDPSRFIGAYDNSGDVGQGKKINGAWERPISVFYQGYTQVNQVRPKAPEATKGLIWMGMDTAYTTCFVPFSTRIFDMPRAYQIGSTQKYDRDSAWWHFNFVANWARLNYKRMTEVDIKPLQKQIEEFELKLVEKWDEICNDMGDKEAARFITKECTANSDYVLNKWRELADTLIAKYTEGYCNLALDSDKPLVTDNKINPAINIGYNSTWLSYTNYNDGPFTYDMK